MASVYEWDGGRALRLFDTSHPRETAEREALAMRAASAAGAPVPSVHDIVEVDGRIGIVMDRVDGPDGLTLLSRRPHRLFALASLTARSHARVLEAAAPTGLRAMRERLALMLSSALVPPELRGRAVATLGALSDGDALCHGDFHPGNILLGPDGPVVIDWTNASRGDPAADHASTRMLLAAGQPASGTPLPLLAVIRSGRRAFLRRYVSVFRRLVAVDEARVRAWLGVIAAARLAEGIDEERERLVVIARSALSGSPHR